MVGWGLACSIVALLLLLLHVASRRIVYGMWRYACINSCSCRESSSQGAIGVGGRSTHNHSTRRWSGCHIHRLLLLLLLWGLKHRVGLVLQLLLLWRLLDSIHLSRGVKVP